MRKLVYSIGNLRFILRSMFIVLLPTMLRVFLQHTSFTAKISLCRFFILINHRQRHEIRSRIRNKFPTASHTSEKPFLGYVVHIISLLAQRKGGKCWFGQPSITSVMKCCFRILAAVLWAMGQRLGTIGLGRTRFMPFSIKEAISSRPFLRMGNVREFSRIR